VKRAKALSTDDFVAVHESLLPNSGTKARLPSKAPANVSRVSGIANELESVRPSQPQVFQSAPPHSGTFGTRGLALNDLDVVFQPIVDLATRRVFAYEALVRCKWPSLNDPLVLFQQASSERCVGRLGRLIREVAIARCPGTPLFINVHPDELSASWLLRADDPIACHNHDIFVEVTESAAFTHHEQCVEVLQQLAARKGVYLAVDDLGSGHSNLKRVLDLEPRIVKLDRTLVTGLDKRPRQQVLVRYLVQLCVDLGAQVVAEGVESYEELLAVGDTGAHLVQGYLFAKPSYPLPRARWPGAKTLPPRAPR
jgi:EAL domain-containing protein (putative c-di-GMP-specific phosphodiesterase class I)